MRTRAREVRAIFDKTTIRVYQAYGPEIAEPAVRAQRFVPPFSLSRMTWIKPSFCWMMYRSGYASKPGQERILGIDITREGFDWALEHAVLSEFLSDVHGSREEWRKLVARSPVRIQWDPERDFRLAEVKGVRAIQIGLSGTAVERYVNEWITRIEDVTPIAKAVHEYAKSGLPLKEQPPFELERRYPVDSRIARTIRATVAD